MLKRVITFFTFFCILNFHAQYINDSSSEDFYTITTSDGLSQNTVNTILKDKTGYVWFGTDNGLNKYNSYDIKYIDLNVEKRKVLTGKKILALYEDDNNNLWIGTNNGLKMYNPIKNQVTSYDLFKNFNVPIRVNSIEKENDSLFWLGTSEGLVLYSSKGDIKKHYRSNPKRINSLTNSDILSLANSEDYLFVGSTGGLNVLNKNNEHFTSFKHDDTNPNSISGNYVKALSLTKNGNLWIGTLDGGISLYNKTDNSFRIFNTKNSDLPHDEIFDINQTVEGDLWIATNGGGLSKLKTKDFTFDNIKHNSNHPQSLTTNSIYSAYEDRDGILWVGTYAEGVCFNASKNNIFKLIRHQVHDKNSIVESKIRSLFIDSKENLWFGTWGGISYYDKTTKQYTSYSHDPKKSESLSFNTVTSIFEDSKGNMWFGTYSGGLNVLNKQKNGFIHYKYSSKHENSISDNKIYCFAQDKLDNLWIGTQTGLNLYNPKTNDFKRFGNIGIRDIKLSNDGRLILGSIGGISIFNPKTEEFDSFYSEKLISFPISEVHLEENDNRIWFGSQGAGMGYLNMNTNQFTFYTEENGLSSNFVSSIVSTDMNSFWVSTFNGLVKFNKKDETFENFGDWHNLPTKQFQPKASVILPDNRIGFGGSKGLIIFHPDSIFKKHRNPRIVLSSLKIDNKDASVGTKGSPLKKSIANTENLVLKSNQNDFSLEFAALDFNKLGGNKYAYILEGYMGEWVNIGTSKSVGFTNLNHGDYTLKLKVINTSSEASEKILNISIAPPFYATWWFKFFILCTLVTLVYYYNKYTIISTKQKNENELQRLKLKSEEDFNQMRFRFFTYISHELRTPLTLISDPISQLIKNKKDKTDKDYHFLKLINKNVFRLLRLVDQILDISKLEGDTLSLQVADQNIVTCIEDTASAFQEFAIQNEITFKFVREHDIINGYIDEDKVEKIIYNLLSNAFKFTPKKGTISIHLNYSDNTKNYIVISVKDNGIGIPEDKLSKIFEGFYQVRSAKQLNPNGAGIGLDYVNRLVKLHLGEISVKSEIDIGSTFTFTLPIKEEFYNIENIKNMVPKRAPLKPTNLNKDEEPKIQIKSKHTKDTPRVLIVEDDFDIRSYLANSLSEKFRVLEAPNGKEGLAKAIKYLPNLILSDTLMPVMDGIEFCKQVKDNEKTSHIPFLFLSAWTSDEFKAKGLSIGAIDYIKKPFSFNFLESRIANIIDTNKKISAKSKTKVDFVPENKDIDSIDDVFIRNAYEVLDKNFDNPEFTANLFIKEMNMSHSGLYRKLKHLTGKSANEFIRDYRLKRAAQIIKQNSGLLISEVCLKSGFNDPKYFSKCFKQVFNMSPTEFSKKYENTEREIQTDLS
ncbi:response regulator [Tamlana fucoidanivorans]|uniref:histidine kinase n=1 Tax=Allotamlana fucoidanivorans TaxID=2583814 RepID=A0A5C4SNV0_9FLAO|nr:two-component regulator propeller domain-containing protein [Tamlana fucoidanivorans]TNJ45851.1 response regulator [Tamlana fucoidanivorans]